MGRGCSADVVVHGSPLHRHLPNAEPYLSEGWGSSSRKGDALALWALEWRACRRPSLNDRDRMIGHLALLRDDGR
jgi:hypothetical protein